jgi:hypothetical protein
LLVVWTIVAMFIYAPESTWGRFLNVGFMISGFVLLGIGLLLGQLGRAARHAELPPAEVTPSAQVTEQKAAENPPPVIT